MEQKSCPVVVVLVVADDVVAAAVVFVVRDEVDVVAVVLAVVVDVLDDVVVDLIERALMCSASGDAQVKENNDTSINQCMMWEGSVDLE